MVGSASTLAQPPRKELLPVPHLALGERPTAQFVLNPNPLAKSSRPDGIQFASGSISRKLHMMCVVSVNVPVAATTSSTVVAPLGVRLQAIRRRIVASGTRLLTWAEVDAQVAELRGKI